MATAVSHTGFLPVFAFSLLASLSSCLFFYNLFVCVFEREGDQAKP